MIAIDIDFGQMFRIKRVFDRQRVKPKMVLNPLQQAIIGLMQPNPDEIIWPRDMRNGFAQVDFLRGLTIMIEARRNRSHASASAMSARLLAKP
jgi:adenylate kinase